MGAEDIINEKHRRMLVSFLWHLSLLTSRMMKTIQTTYLKKHCS